MASLRTTAIRRAKNEALNRIKIVDKIKQGKINCTPEGKSSADNGGRNCSIPQYGHSLAEVLTGNQHEVSHREIIYSYENLLPQLEGKIHKDSASSTVTIDYRVIPTAVTYAPKPAGIPRFTIEGVPEAFLKNITSDNYLETSVVDSDDTSPGKSLNPAASTLSLIQNPYYDKLISILNFDIPEMDKAYTEICVALQQRFCNFIAKGEDDLINEIRELEKHISRLEIKPKAYIDNKGFVHIPDIGTFGPFVELVENKITTRYKLKKDHEKEYFTLIPKYNKLSKKNSDLRNGKGILNYIKGGTGRLLKLPAPVVLPNKETASDAHTAAMKKDFISDVLPASASVATANSLENSININTPVKPEESANGSQNEDVYYRQLTKIFTGFEITKEKYSPLYDNLNKYAEEINKNITKLRNMKRELTDRIPVILNNYSVKQFKDRKEKLKATSIFGLCVDTVLALDAPEYVRDNEFRKRCVALKERIRTLKKDYENAMLKTRIKAELKKVFRAPVADFQPNTAAVPDFVNKCVKLKY